NATSPAPPPSSPGRLPHPFGEMPWPVRLGEAEERSVLVQARRHCPDWDDAPAGFEYRVAALDVSFVPRPYRLVRVSLHADDDVDHERAHGRDDDHDADSRRVEPGTRVVYAFYAPGDFRPLDAAGRGIDELRRYAPIELAADDAITRVADYACLRLALEAPVAWWRWRVRGSDSATWEQRAVPAAVITSAAMLGKSAERLEPAARETLKKAIG